MPRGVKGSGKAAVKNATAKKVVKSTEEKSKAVKARKPYPSREERIDMALKQIDRLTKLNDSRRKLVAKTEKTLNERKLALEKSEEMLSRAIARKERLSTTPEKLAKERLTKKAEMKKLDEVLAKLKASGKSIDDVLNAL